MNAIDLAYIPLAAVTAPIWARKSRSGWGERLGKIEPVSARQDGQGRPRPRVLLHAVSVGEVSALRELAPILAREAHLIISVGTDTGIKRARELFAGSGLADVVRYPLDFSWSVRRFMDAVRPDAVGLVELEIWPNFVSECVRRGIPIGVINGRLSERSFKGYARLRPVFRRWFGMLQFAAVQDEDYARRFEHMGVESNRVLLTGSMKWDSAKIEDQVAGAEDLAREMGIRTGPGAPPIVVAGSTAEDEEALLHAACARIGEVQLVCAPRKPEHFGEAASALPGCVRRTSREARVGATRFLLDTIGELRKAYALADVVVVGRSFGTLFGSDPIEPIALGKATLIGPAVGDFAQIVRVFREGDGLVQCGREQVEGELRRLLGDAEARRGLAERGRAVIRAQQGASARHAELMLSLVRA